MRDACEGGISEQLNSFINLMSLAAFLEMQVPFGTIAAASERVSLNEESAGMRSGGERSRPGDYRDHVGSVRTLRRKVCSLSWNAGIRWGGVGGRDSGIIWINPIHAGDNES